MKYRAEVTGIKEGTWSNNSMEYDSVEECQSWLKGLASRWFGFDMSRIVPCDTPHGEVVDMGDERIYQNFRR